MFAKTEGAFGEAAPPAYANDPMSGYSAEQEQADARARLTEFYSKNNAAKLGQVETVLAKYVGRYHELWRDLDRTYGPEAVFMKIVGGIEQIYTNKIKPLEEYYRFPDFHSPILTRGEIASKPMVMLMGQYSVGKTTFIKHLLERDFPGSRIGPEPTTDRFMALMHHHEERTIPGNALALEADAPFRSLSMFGTNFLSKFEASCLPSPILEKLTFIDTPGVLSGEKQRIGRQYDFSQVVEWFAERSDRILLLFDAHKLDISDEFKHSIDALRGHDDKIRVVLNKADSVTPNQLMRVYGALMWSLGKVVLTPEVLRVYIGSFWDEPLNEKGLANKAMFDQEKKDLIDDLKSLPRNSALRKVNELVKRTRTAKVHALIIGHLRYEMPSMFGKDKKQQELIDNLVPEFRKVQIQHNLPSGDFPNVERFRDKLQNMGCSFSDFPKLKDKHITKVMEALDTDIPQLLAQIPGMNTTQKVAANPFDMDDKPNIGTIMDDDKIRYSQLFTQLTAGSPSGKLAGQQVAGYLTQTYPNLSREVMRDIWALSDIDKDGALDCDEFIIAIHLSTVVMKTGGDRSVLPASLPMSIIPPSKY
jgi:GTP-binding protein EngB required for normal cell division